MQVIKLKERLERMHQLIQLQATGTPTQFSEKLGISERSLYQTLEQLREMGAPLKYSAHRRSYYYSKPVYFRYGYELK